MERLVGSIVAVMAVLLANGTALAQDLAKFVIRDGYPRTVTQGTSAEASSVSRPFIRDGELYLIIIDDGPRNNIVEFSLKEFDVDSQMSSRIINSEGFRDLEGIALISPGVFALADEATGIVHIVEISAWTKVVRMSDSVEDIATGLFNASSRDGMEGVAYDPSRNVYYLAVEADINASTKYGVYAVLPDDPKSHTLIVGGTQLDSDATDVSDVYFDPSSRQLYVLSDDGASIYQFDLSRSTDAGMPVAKLSLHGLRRDLCDLSKQPEGLAVSEDGTVLIVVGEPNCIAVFDKRG